MRSLPAWARVYIVGLVGAAAALAARFATLPSRSELHLFLGLLIATIAGSIFKLRLPTARNRATISVAFIVDFASLLLLGPHQTILVASLGAIGQSVLRVQRRTSVYQVLVNVASLIITVEAAGVMYRAVGGGLAPLNWTRDAAPIVAAVTTFFFVNSAAIAGAIALATRQRPSRVWEDGFLWAGPTYFLGAVISTVIAEVGATRMWDFLPLAVAPVYVIFRAYSIFAGRVEEEHRHREVIESLNEGMAVVQSDGFIALWNDSLERIMGVPRRQALGRTLTEAVPELARTALPQKIASVLETGSSERIEYLTIQRQGRSLTLDVRVFVFTNGVAIFWSDITDRAEAQLALRDSEERYALAAAGSNDGLWDWDLASGELYLSPRWHAMLGLPHDGPPSEPTRAWFDRIHPEDHGSFRAALDAHLAGTTEHFEHEHRVRHQSGGYRRVLCRGVAVRQSNGAATRIAGSQTDITERAAIQEQLQHAAVHDALTGLPNRLLFIELLGRVLDRSRRHHDHMFAVLFLDIDRFKVVNDSLGHQCGDELLVGVSRRLEACMRQGDSIARLGGDEFTILLNDLTDVTQASVIAGRILQALRDPFTVKGREVFVSGSIGIALSATGYRKPEEIMRDADTAMYRAKALGKARYELFDASMHARAVERLRLEGDLQRAIERGEFTLHYQPIVALKTGRWTGFEALLRWQRDGREMSPAEFIPIVEEMGLIDLLGTWVIKEACRQTAVWRERFPNLPAIGVTVNVSARQLSRADFVQTVRDAVWAANLRAGDLRIEITETTLMENPEGAEVVLRELTGLGVKVYLDDFGTGFSSLSYLHRFPVDTLKIDQSFIASLSNGKSQPVIVQSIVALAKTLGTRVIAEGVETEAQMAELLRLGCSEAQGFFFARPLPPHIAETFLEQSERIERQAPEDGKRGRLSVSTLTH